MKMVLNSAVTARFGGASVMILAAMIAPHGALAQTTTAAPPSAPAASAGDGAPQDIIVTAQKRSQKLNDVGISIVAATGAQLQTSGVTDVAQLAKIAPGFSVGRNYQGFAVFSLRGVNFNASQFSAAPAVSTYIDEAILPYSAMTSGLLLDVDHVEVLKGPQGTLFGQNATGGSVNVIAAKPTNHFAAGFDTEVNNFGQVIADGFVSGPLSETLRVRLAAQTTQFGAYQRGYYLNHDKNGDQNRGAARLLVDWTPTDKLKVGVNLNANYDHGEVLQFQFARIAPGHELNPGLQPGLIGYPAATNDRDADIPRGFDTHAHNRLYQGVVRVDYEFSDAATLTSLTNFVDFKSIQPQNITGVAIPIQSATTTGNDRTFSQEVHLGGKLIDNKLNYIVGGNYEHDKIKERQYLFANAYSLLPPNTLLDTVYHPKNDQKAVFANVDFEVVPKLTLTGGLRYTWIKESTIGCTGGNAAGAAIYNVISTFIPHANGQLPYGGVGGGCLTVNDDVPNFAATVPTPGTPIGTLVPDLQPIGNDVSQKERNLSWRGGANYKFAPNSLLYALISRGYKAGGYPVQPDVVHSGFVPVKQEKLTSYEIGAKLDLLDHALRLNVAAFYYDYVDKQFYTYINTGIGPTSTVKNIPKSTVKGAEFDATVNPFQGLTLRAAATYIKTKVGQFSTTNSTGATVSVTGSEFNYAPPFSATADIEYRFPVSADVHAYVGGDGLYNSRTFGDLGEAATQLIPHYLVLGARVGVESEKGWRFGLFVRNLANKYYWTGVFFAGDTIARVAGQPRSFGATAGFKF